MLPPRLAGAVLGGRGVGCRLRRAGVSPTRLDGRSLDAASHAEAIDAAAQPEIRGRAETLGRRMRAEDGLATAVTRIEALMR